MKTLKGKITILTISLLLVGVMFSLAYAADSSVAKEKDLIKKINSMNELDKIVKEAGSDLLMFDLYADWCMPCKMLAPTLKEIAREKKDKVTIYKVDTDKHPDIAAAFGVSGIPHVAFIQNGKAVYVLTGFRPKSDYLQVISHFTTLEKK